LTGHKTRSVFDRYDITSERDLIDKVQRVSGYLSERPSERKVVKLGSLSKLHQNRRVFWITTPR
jgi:hypothetical protein